jgi:AcrR family transcriptional regulator
MAIDEAGSVAGSGGSDGSGDSTRADECRSQRPGRRRDDSRDPEILNAALEVLAETGYERMTMDAVAARAKAGKATLYRRWPSKAQLVVDAVACTGSADKPLIPADTGSLRGDLLALSAGDAGAVDARQVQLMTGLISVLPLDADLAAIVRERLVEPRRLRLRTVFERAVARGEIPPERDLDALSLVVPAMVFHRLVILNEPVDLSFIASLLEQIILPLATAPMPGPATISQ